MGIEQCTKLSRGTNRHLDTAREYSSSPCWMHEVDPSYLGYWSREEMVAFLKSLLERERIGTRAFADIGHAADLRIADLILESELDQGSICILLESEIAKRGAAVPAPRKRPTDERRVKFSLEQAVASARSNQTELIQTIEEAVLGIFLISELNSHLMKMTATSSEANGATGDAAYIEGLLLSSSAPSILPWRRIASTFGDRACGRAGCSRRC